MAEKKTAAHSTILVPVDFSDDSKAALIWACQQALSLGASVVVLHVVHDPASAPGYYRNTPGAAFQPMEEIAAKMMRRFLKRVGKKIKNKKYFKRRLTTELVTGLPETRILEVCKSVGASHIVMGSQGLTGLKRILLGSKAEQIVRTSPVPVTIVKGKKSGKGGKGAKGDDPDESDEIDESDEVDQVDESDEADEADET
ncbi:MAG: universal stress protein [Deltaproteobacteria bacterium]|nr:MAG: universal stress protein [Deltaproteobacteria bacterium]